MADEYEPNALDREFESFFKKVSCFVVTGFPYEDRCAFVLNATSCIAGTNFVPYMRIMSCDIGVQNQFQELVFVSVLLLLCFELLLGMAVVVNSYYSPALKVLSRLCRLNEHLAGVTFLAIGNSTPDMFSDLSGLDDVSPVVANTFSLAMFVTIFTGGLICYMSPFKMNKHATVRDILFFILGVSLLEYVVTTGNEVTLTECIFMFVVYFMYLIVNFADVYLMRATMRHMLRQIIVLEKQNLTPELKKKLETLQKKYNYYAEDEHFQILQRRSRAFSFNTGGNSDRFTFSTRKTDIPRHTVDIHGNRNVFHSSTVPRNHRLCKDFLEALNPIDVYNWKKANLSLRAFYVAKAPVTVICVLYIPLVDYELDRHGWTKLLNCIQIFLNPAITLIVGQAFIFRDKGTLWYNRIRHTYQYGLYSCIVTIPLAFIVFLHSRTTVPPSYHWVYTIMNLTGSMCLIFQTASEISVILGVIGSTLEVPNDFMGVTVNTIANGLSDVVANMVMAMQGYEKMAYAACIGSPFFNVLLSHAVMFITMNIQGKKGNIDALNGLYGENSYIFLNLSLFLTLLWTLILNFEARRSVGAFSMAIYILYILFSIFIYQGVIHSYSKDPTVLDTFDIDENI
ncbi:mitochondrial sodium/calcium exchanger protein-like [Drosophila busckii]|uniref:mitochondrial sodium/calcium exchanger protein-like n=1 Tax=Drosophila busckii TaxID=30019 RepID=UPI00083F382C|nr:mitochondrial sodium/calcium exchanger protein-like [Drosophila busckii]